MNQNNIQEIFTLPINTVEIGDLDGFKLYTSESLIKKYIGAMKEYHRTSDIGNEIEKMVMEYKINPCWMNNNIFKLLVHKAVGGVNKMTMGFFTPEHKKIFLLIDNNVSFGFASDSRLAQLTLHEGMHFAATTMKIEYASYFKKELDLFYTEYFRKLFNIDNKENISKEAHNVWMFAFEKSELNYTNDVSEFLKNNEKCIRDNFEKFKTPHFNDIVKDYSSLIYLYFKGGLDILIPNMNRYVYIIRPLYEAYSKVFKTNSVNSFCIQELFYPSEVICIASEFIKDLGKIQGAFKKIA